MRKFILGLAIGLGFVATVSYAVTILPVGQGGTGWGFPGGIQGGYILIGNWLKPFATSTGLTYATSTDTLTATNITVTGTCTNCGSGGSGTYPFTPTLLSGIVYSATTSPMLFYAPTITSSSSVGNLTVGSITATSSVSFPVGSITDTMLSSTFLKSYDAWTHPATGQSATTSTILIPQSYLASSSIGYLTIGSLYATTSTATSTFAGGVEIGTSVTGVDIYAGNITPKIAIATSSPYAPLSVNGKIAATVLSIDGTAATSTFADGLRANGIQTLGFMDTPFIQATSLTASSTFKGLSAQNIKISGALIDPTDSIGTSGHCLLSTGTSFVWNVCPTGATLTYFFWGLQSTSSPQYLRMVSTATTTQVTATFTGVTNGQILTNRITDAGVPNLSEIPSGTFNVHTYIAQTSGAQNGNVHFDIWEVNSSGTDIAKIGTTESTAVYGGLTGTVKSFDLTLTTSAPYVLANTSSRILVRAIAEVSGGGGAPTITLTFGNGSDAHLVLPANSVDVTSFVPYTGATANVDLGLFSLTANKLLINGTATSSFSAGVEAPTIAAQYFVATSTTASSTLQNLLATQIQATGVSASASSFTTLCLTGDTCRTTWPTAGAAYPFTPLTSWGALAQSTTSLLAFPQALIGSTTIGQLTIPYLTSTSTATSTFNGGVLLAQNSGQVGIGTSDTFLGLTVSDGIYSERSWNTGNPLPDTINGGSADRSIFFWYPKKTALRVGEWDVPLDTTLIGSDSMAFGYDNVSSGYASYSSGFTNTASGDYSTAIGDTNIASGRSSFAGGDNSQATSTSAFAFGHLAKAGSGGVNTVIALGVEATAHGAGALVIGGDANEAYSYCSIVGGFTNVCGSQNSSIIGGTSNTILGNGTSVNNYSSIIGGQNNTISAPRSIAIGSFLTTNTDQSISIGNGLNTNPMVNNSGGIWLGSGSDQPTMVIASTSAGVGSVGKVGIGTTSPYAKLSVVGETVAANFTATSTTVYSTFASRIGIATTSPSTELSINGSVPTLRFGNGTAGDYGDIFLGATGNLDFNSAPGKKMLLGSDYIAFEDQTFGAEYFTFDFSNKLFNINGLDFNVLDTSGANAFTVSSGAVNASTKGNVGIATSSPYAKLSVVGETVSAYFTATTTATSTFAGGINSSLQGIFGTGLTVSGGQITVPAGTVGSPSITFSGNTNTGIYSSGSNQVSITSNGSLVADFQAGTLRFPRSPYTLDSANTNGFFLTNASESAAVPSYSFSGDTNNGIFSPGNDLLAFTQNGIESARFTPGNLFGIGTTTPFSILSVAATSSLSNLPVFAVSTVPSLGATSTPLAVYSDNTVDLSQGTVRQHIYPSFTYATSTAWSATSTIPLGTAYVAETWKGIQCFTDAGTLDIFITDGTNRMNWLRASTTVGTVTLTTNSAFTVGEKRYVEVGNPLSSPLKISCTVDKIVNQ